MHEAYRRSDVDIPGGPADPATLSYIHIYGNGFDKRGWPKTWVFDRKDNIKYRPLLKIYRTDKDFRPMTIQWLYEYVQEEASKIMCGIPPDGLDDEDVEMGQEAGDEGGDGGDDEGGDKAGDEGGDVAGDMEMSDECITM